MPRPHSGKNTRQQRIGLEMLKRIRGNLTKHLIDRTVKSASTNLQQLSTKLSDNRLVSSSSTSTSSSASFLRIKRCIQEDPCVKTKKIRTVNGKQYTTYTCHSYPACSQCEGRMCMENKTAIDGQVLVTGCSCMSR